MNETRAIQEQNSSEARMRQECFMSNLSSFSSNASFSLNMDNKLIFVK